MKPTDEIRQYWREGRTRRYNAAHPERFVRKEAISFLSKKEALTEGEDSTELLEETLNKIRAILTGESVDEIDARRRSR